MCFCPDVYDCPVWKDVMGPLVQQGGRIILTRMGFIVCFDAFPAFHKKRKGAISLCPGELINLSLPPHLRYDPDNIIIWMLIPNEMTSSSQLKYFNYVMRTEMNPLRSHGVTGPDGPVSIKLFGAALDLKGKEKFYHQMSVQSYCGCSTCCVHFDQGPDGPIFALARRYLPPHHPLRLRRCVFKGHEFEFHNDEVRGAPPIKTSQTIFNYNALRRRRNVTHVLGQKGEMMLSSYIGLKYESFNLLEWMHNMACAYDNFIKFLTGNDKQLDARSRRTCKGLGVFRSIWTDNIVYLSTVRSTALRSLTDDQISTMSTVVCRRWLRICCVAVDVNMRVNELRARVTELRNRLINGERIVLRNQLNPLPWRLSDVARNIINNRALNVVYPHYTPLCHIDNDSFINGAGCWRTTAKLVAFLVILVPVLRGFVPKFRAGLRSLIWGIRILEGRTLSAQEANDLNLESGSKALKKSDIAKARVLISEGLSMIEGCCPISCIAPAVHCLCHYADGAEKHGLLRLLWMINFGMDVFFLCYYKFYTFYYIYSYYDVHTERYNKKCKNLTANKNNPIVSLGNALVRDGTARYFRWRKRAVTTRADKIPVTELTGFSKLEDIPDCYHNAIQSHLRCGCRIQHCTTYAYKMGNIGGKKFNAGELLRVGRRCGSVVTMVSGVESVYGLIKRFYRVNCQCHTFIDFAIVTWFPSPHYPDRDPLTVEIGVRGLDVNNITQMSVVPLSYIQPSRIAVELNNMHQKMYMLRIEGIDSNPVFDN